MEQTVPIPTADGQRVRYVRKRIKKRLCNKQYLIVARGAAKTMYASCIQSYFLNIDTTTTHQIATAYTMRQADETLSPIRTAIVRSRGPLFKFLTEGSLQNTTGSRAKRAKLASTKKGIENFITSTSRTRSTGRHLTDMLNERYLGALYHHGIKGMKWGVRRTPEQLGHAPPAKKTLAKSEDSVIMDGEFYRSRKGFVIHPNKLRGYCLKPGAKHAEQFFKMGYTENDEKRLFQDLEKGYDPSKKVDCQPTDDGYEKSCIPMELGVTSKRLYRTVWRNDGPENSDRFISAYIDRRLKED